MKRSFASPFLSLFALHLVISLSMTTRAAAATTNEKPFQECRDHAHFNCRLIAEEGDCEAYTEHGELIGDTFCQVSCGRCSAADDQIFADLSCYSFAKQEITITFLNRSPEHGDWVGVYPAFSDLTNLGGPIAWYWLCGNKKDKCKTGIGSVTFPWLPPGTYKAVLVRHDHRKGHGGPYASYADSTPFEVVRGTSCSARRTQEQKDIVSMSEVKAAHENGNSLRGSS
mmetsp:Transcript_26271/g.49027  ORF Transcript_26271/g.49027 Transcript_26271/m.49027 type:complete len:227 (+) Transcript_26271:133-813(+)